MQQRLFRFRRACDRGGRFEPEALEPRRMLAAATGLPTADVAPSVTVTAPRYAVADAQTRIDVDIVDPAADTFSLTMDFGDGREPLHFDGIGHSFGINYSFLRHGTANVVATVSDNASGTGTGSVTVRVVDVLGTVFHDDNDNGRRDPGEQAWEGATVYLDADDNGRLDPGEVSATTDAAGMYLFDGLTPGAYVLREVAPEGWRYGVPATGVYRVNLTAEVGATPDFGLTQRSRIDGFAFEDRNGNGVRDAVDVPLRQGGDVFADLNGNGFEDDHDPRTLVLPPNQTYGLANLSPGNYPLRIMLPGAAGLNYVQTTPPLGSAVTLGTAELLTGVDIGVAPLFNGVNGVVFDDRNGNGVLDAGEPGVPNRTVYADADDNGRLDPGETTALTRPDGSYALRVIPGTYTVREVLPENWVQTTPADRSAYFVTLVFPNAANGRNFGTARTPSAAPAVQQGKYVFSPQFGSGVDSIELTFNDDVMPTLAATDLTVAEQDTGYVIDRASQTLSYDRFTNKAKFEFPGLAEKLPAGRYRATLPAASVFDPLGRPMSADFTMDFDVHSFVMARRTFYNDSAFDGGDSAAGPGDDAAIAADKTAALPGQALGFSNATSYSRGITGIMVDVRSLPAGIGRTVTPDDFEFRAGVSGQPSGWAVAPAPESVTVRRGDGVFNHSDRITAIWPDGAVKNESLQVTLKANADTGLTAADVFFFGNLVGEAGDGISLLRVSALDLAAVKRALNTDSDVTGRYDFNRDGRVNAIDLAAVRSNLNRSLPGIAAAAAPALASTAPAVPEPSLLRMAEVGDEESDNILS